MIPAHVAAYAAGITALRLDVNWPGVVVFMERLGMGKFDAQELALAATQWTAANVNAKALALHLEEKVQARASKANRAKLRLGKGAA